MPNALHSLLTSKPASRPIAAVAPKPPAAAPKAAISAPRPPPIGAQVTAPAPLPLPPLPASIPTPSLQPIARAPAGATDDAAFDESAHFRDVYDQYVATRKQCGEAIDNLTFEKFGVTLRKTRDQILEKQGVKMVRFSVQIKEGKAALKAQPIKR